MTAQGDALVGRLVLLYLDDPAAVLRRLLEAASGDRIRQTFARAGSTTGLKPARIRRDAGLPAPETLQGARVESGPDSPVYAYVAQTTTRTLLPLMERTGVATATEVEVDLWPPGCGSRSWPPTPPSSRRPSSAPGPGSRPRLRHPLEWGVIAVDQALHLSVLVLLAVALTA